MASTTVPVKREGGLRRRDPFALVDWMEKDWPWFSLFRPLGEAGTLAEWRPRIDVFEQKGKMVVKAELPGIEKKDLKVEFEDGDLILKGERKTEEEVEEDDYYRCERSFGSFFRRIPLGFEVDPDAIKAQFKDGVLEVKLPIPKEHKTHAKTIAVN